MTDDQVFRLASKARLQRDPKTQKFVLLYPERGLALSDTAAGILQLCDGRTPVVAIVDTLAARYSQSSRADVERDVFAFLQSLLDRALLEPV